MVVSVQDPAQRSIPFCRYCVASDAAVNADGRSGLEVPLTRVVLFERLVRKNAGGADLDQVPAEFAFERALFMPAEIDVVVGPEHIKVAAASVISIEPDATVALDAAVHLVIDKGSQVLVVVRAFFEPRSAVSMAGHDRHILKVAFAAFIADRAVMRMVQHEPFDDARPESPRIGVVNGQPHAFGHQGHAGHGDPAVRILVVLEHLDRALTASAHGVQGRVPAEVGKVEPQREAGLEQVLAFLYLMGFIVDINSKHFLTLISTDLL